MRIYVFYIRIMLGKESSVSSMTDDPSDARSLILICILPKNASSVIVVISCVMQCQHVEEIIIKYLNNKQQNQ